MAIYRLYAGDDGQSHIEETSLADHPELGDAQAAQSINFREWPPGHFIDWHPAPRRQYIISLRGEIEIGLGMAPRSATARETRAWWKTPPDRDTPPA